MIDPVTLGLIAKGVGAIAGGIQGYSDMRKGSKALKALGDTPQYIIPEEIEQNQNIAKYYAQQGLDAETLYGYRRDAERGLTSTTSAMLNAGGSINSVGRAYDNFLQGNSKIAQLNNQALVANRKNLTDANLDMATKLDDLFAFRLKDYNNKRQEALGMKQAGKTALFGAIGSLAGTGVQYGNKAPSIEMKQTKDAKEGSELTSVFEFTPEGFEGNSGDTNDLYNLINKGVGQNFSGGGAQGTNSFNDWYNKFISGGI